MPLGNISALPSVRRQNLLVEFSSLKYAAPQGVYMSLSPNNDTSLWWGVMFVRKGPYRGAILKFTIYFPDKYPVVPPIVTFFTSIYHPLVHPQTSSATKPGVYSLRHGFPHWFPAIERMSTSVSPSPPALPPRPSSISPTLSPSDRKKRMEKGSVQRDVTIVQLLDYIKSTFDDENILDEIPLSAAENAFAWKSWTQGAGRRAGSGGWDERVRFCVEKSTSDEELYGGMENSERDMLIRFLPMDRDTVETVKKNIIRIALEKEILRGCYRGDEADEVIMFMET